MKIKPILAAVAAVSSTVLFSGHTVQAQGFPQMPQPPISIPSPANIAPPNMSNLPGFNPGNQMPAPMPAQNPGLAILSMTCNGAEIPKH